MNFKELESTIDHFSPNKLREIYTILEHEADLIQEEIVDGLILMDTHEYNEANLRLAEIEKMTGLIKEWG